MINILLCMIMSNIQGNLAPGLDCSTVPSACRLVRSKKRSRKGLECKNGVELLMLCKWANAKKLAFYLIEYFSV